MKLSFNGETDICSLGKDVNFVFKGFGITGKVALVTGSGAKGVNVELKSEDGKDVRRTVTDVNGIFSFTPIIPGKYIVKTTHPKWYFEKDEYTVVVEGGNTVLPENSLLVSGFDVTGRFDTSDIGSGIGIALFKSKSVSDEIEYPGISLIKNLLSFQNSASLKCNKQGLKSSITNSVAANYDDTPSCYATIGNNGGYMFKNVAPGNYIVLPVVEDKNLKLNIKPTYIEIDVSKDTLELKQEFKVHIRMNHTFIIWDYKCYFHIIID